MLHTRSHSIPIIFSPACPASWFVLFQEDIHNVISKASFLQPWFVNLQKSFAYVDHTFLVPKESARQSLERQWEIMIWSSSVQEKKFISRSIIGLFLLFSINFSCFQNDESLPVISSFWKFFACPYLSTFDFEHPPVFRK